ncbi:Membrane-bound acyltransferase YfiQ, involved in biofilm formation [Eubacterium ruminantium]|nr:Membrane-bound acyltransferase YfiQ, involved in biofilm formation [Eubacterium ruminantium]
MADIILLIFPLTIFIILFAGAKVRRNDASGDEAWNLDQAKAMQVFAALMVILHHMVQRITDCGGIDKGLITEWNSFGILCTSIFFFFSGFGLYKSCKTKENYLVGMLRKRLPTILIPFYAINIIYLIVDPRDRLSNAFDVFTSLIGFTLVNSNAWFVVELSILYIAFYLCFRKSGSERKAICRLTVFTLMLVTTSLLLGHDTTKVRGHWFMGEWWYNTTLIFIMGILFAKNESRIKAFMTRRWKILLPVSLLLLVGWYIFEEYIEANYGYYREWQGHPGYPEKLLTLVVQLIFCMIFMFIILLVNLKLQFGNPALRFLGSITYEIYLIHDIYRWSLPGGPECTMPDMLYLGLTYILTIISAYIIAKSLSLITQRRK